MSWTKPLGTATAKAGANDMSLQIRREPSANDGAGDWLFILAIEHEGAGAATDSSGALLANMVAAGALTDAQKTAMMLGLAKIRDYLLTERGYVQS